MDWEAAARAAKDFFNWTAPLLPVRLGWVLLAIGVVLAAGYLIGKWRH